MKSILEIYHRLRPVFAILITSVALWLVLFLTKSSPLLYQDNAPYEVGQVVVLAICGFVYCAAGTITIMNEEWV